MAVEDGLTWPRKVERSRRRDMGSTPSRYQRSNVPTANECRRQCRCGDLTPEGTMSGRAGHSLWNIQLMLLVPMGVLLCLAKENTGQSSAIGPKRDSSDCIKDATALAIFGPKGTRRSF